MSEEHQIERPPPFGEIPEEYLDPEGDAELQDPTLVLESTSDMRRAWNDWFCSKGPGEFANVKFFGRGIGGVPAPAVDAYKALESALSAAGYRPGGAWSNKCRKIAGTDRYSLHSYGVAVDIDSRENPMSKGDPYSGKIKKVHVDAALSIRNNNGRRVWEWGGSWRTPDRMHFQLDRGPDDVIIDPATIPGAVHVTLEGVTHYVEATTLNMRDQPSLSGGVIAAIPDGAQVAAQTSATHEGDGYVWRRVEAVVGSQLVGGWVADEFLGSIGGTTPQAETAAPATPGATHRVTATSLNLRREPTTSGEMIGSLPNGAKVAVQPGTPRENDDYLWVEVKASLTDGDVEGWVAGKYLEPTR